MDRQVGKPQSFKQQLFGAEHRSENIKVALSVTVFTGAVVFLRQFGQLLAV
ncbi:hypothetical protein DM01DRAFT_1287631 [Hesseltinella vesiculosa]|uniref:Uncharacterized protein n=1 Tax=Hesseltinella vesiculosa TaxID=101127 RepID=A0A1X2GGX3_9FUNG|nr:hypothetical protein DM01DRAFT_1287631 [Hesseltinella vesiculosa]